MLKSSGLVSSVPPPLYRLLLPFCAYVVWWHVLYCMSLTLPPYYVVFPPLRVGEVLSAGVSAKKRIGLDELLEKILLQVSQHYVSNL